MSRFGHHRFLLEPRALIRCTQVEAGLYSLKRVAFYLKKTCQHQKEAAVAILEATKHETEKRSRILKDKCVVRCARCCACIPERMPSAPRSLIACPCACAHITHRMAQHVQSYQRLQDVITQTVNLQHKCADLVMTKVVDPLMLFFKEGTVRPHLPTVLI